MATLGLKNYINKFRHYFRFSKPEIEAAVISVILLAFIVSFKEWGQQTFELSTGLFNLLISILIVGFILGIQIGITKLQSLKIGYRAEFKIWWYGLGIGLIVIFLTQGNVWFLVPGGFFFHHLATHRLGWFRYGLNMKDTAISCLAGSFATLMIAVIARLLLFIAPESIILGKVLTISIWIALFSMLPFPPLAGSRVFFFSRLTYFFVLGIYIGAAILLNIEGLNLLITLVLSLVIGAIVWGIYLWKVES